jgi:hypothetical protein
MTTHGEGALDFGWYADVIALAASLILAWPVVRTSFRLRRAETVAAPIADRTVRQNDVLARVWSATAAALREPLWTRGDHYATLIGVGLFIIATVLKVLSKWIL